MPEEDIVDCQDMKQQAVVTINRSIKQDLETGCENNTELCSAVQSLSEPFEFRANPVARCIEVAIIF